MAELTAQGKAGFEAFEKTLLTHGFEKQGNEYVYTNPQGLDKRTLDLIHFIAGHKALRSANKDNKLRIYFSSNPDNEFSKEKLI